MTYSIVARDSASGAMGVCVTTTVACVGALAPHVSLRAAVSTQAYVNVDLGLEILERIEDGQQIDAALHAALRADPGREQRQLVGIDSAGLTSAFTGSEVLPDSGHLLGRDHAVAGNLLASSAVLKAMSVEFERSEGREFVDRLIGSVAVGLAAGGERESEDFAETMGSAAVIVASESPKGFHNLRVDASTDPVGDLRRVYESALASAHALDEFYAGAIVVRPTFWRRVWNGRG